MKREKESLASDYYMSLGENAPAVYKEFMENGFYQYCEACITVEKTLPDTKVYTFTSNNNDNGKKETLDIYMDDDGKGLVFAIDGGKEIVWRNRPKCEVTHCHRSRCIVRDSLAPETRMDLTFCEIGRHLPDVGGVYSCSDGCMNYDSCVNQKRRRNNADHEITYRKEAELEQGKAFQKLGTIIHAELIVIFIFELILGIICNSVAKQKKKLQCEANFHHKDETKSRL
jgi:hypothetical protein